MNAPFVFRFHRLWVVSLSGVVGQEGGVFSPVAPEWGFRGYKEWGFRGYKPTAIPPECRNPHSGAPSQRPWR